MSILVDKNTRLIVQGITGNEGLFHTVVILFAVMIVNLLVDISYAFLDPRIRYGGGSEE